MAWDLGDTIPLTTEITDAAGALTSATGVVCTVGLPDGTTATPSVSTPSVGRYISDYVAVQAGRHTERWTSTVPATARSDQFDVRAATPAYLVSLADARAHLNFIDSAARVDDEELRAFIETASEQVERLSNQAVVKRSFTERRSIVGATDRIILGHVPAVSLTSYVAVGPGFTGAPALSELDLTPSGVLFVRNGARSIHGDLAITYTAGYAAPPARFAAAAKMAIANLWQTQRGSRGAPRLGRDQLDAAISRTISMSDIQSVLGPTPGGFA